MQGEEVEPVEVEEEAEEAESCGVKFCNIVYEITEDGGRINITVRDDNSKAEVLSEIALKLFESIDGMLRGGEDRRDVV